MDRKVIITYLSIAIILLHLSPFSIVTNVAIILLFVFTFIDVSIGEKLVRFSKKRSNLVLLLPFLIFLISTLYSSPIEDGWKVLEIRLSLLIFPLIYGVANLKEQHVTLILKWTIWAITLIPVAGFIYQFQLYHETGDTGYFYNDNLVSIVEKQAVYYGLFINMALLFLFALWNRKKFKRKPENFASILAFLILLVAQYLLACRIATITTLILCIGYVAMFGAKRLNKKQMFLVVFGGVIILAVLPVIFPKVLNRFESITNLRFEYDNTNPINHFNGEIKEENWNGFNARLALWSCAWEEIQESPLIGHGLGNVQSTLTKNYRKKNFYLALDRNYNCHNQYLDITLSNGIIGLGIFLLFIRYFLLEAIRQRNWVLFGVMIVFSIACLTENILSRNQGVVLVSLMFSLNIFSSENEKHIIQ